MARLKKQNYSDDEREIFKFMHNLPSVTLLNPNRTIDQSLHWQSLRISSVYMAWCWRSLHTGKNDPLETRLESGRISKHAYEMAWLEAKFFASLWQLIQISFSKIRPVLKKCGFDVSSDSAFDLFVLVVTSIRNDQFRECLIPYVEVSFDKLIKDFRLIQKVSKGEGSSVKRKKVIEIAGKNQDSLLMAITNACMEKANRSNSLILGALRNYLAASTDLVNHAAKVGEEKRSYSWNKGEKVKSQRGGSYAKKPRIL